MTISQCQATRWHQRHPAAGHSYLDTTHQRPEQHPLLHDVFNRLLHLKLMDYTTIQHSTSHYTALFINRNSMLMIIFHSVAKDNCRVDWIVIHYTYTKWIYCPVIVICNLKDTRSDLEMQWDRVIERLRDPVLRNCTTVVLGTMSHAFGKNVV